jgi:DNA invertase Pin-like site-specific DNA recombinase
VRTYALRGNRRRVVAIPMVGYVTVGAEQRERARQDTRSQVDTIEAECERLGLALLEVVRDREPKRGHALERPGLGYALKLIGAGDAKGIAVAELSRLGHSLPELGRVLEWILLSDVRLIAASPSLDTTDEVGRLTVRTVIDVSHWEHRRLVERTRTGILAARRRGPRGVAENPALRERIVRMRDEGMTLQAIADRLNAEGVPTVRGGAKWRPSSVQNAVGYKRPVSGGGRAPALEPPGRRAAVHA